MKIFAEREKVEIRHNRRFKKHETNQKECPDYYKLFLPKVKFKANVTIKERGFRQKRTKYSFVGSPMQVYNALLRE